LREKFVNVDGVNTRYIEAESADSNTRQQPLLLIHGGHFGRYDSADDWGLNIDSLGKHFRVYAIDKIGSGFTDNPKSDNDYLIGSTVKHAFGFVKALGLEKVNVVGHSRGGYAATRLALEHPEAFATLTIVDSSTLMTPPNPIYEQWDREAEKIADHRAKLKHLVAANSYSDKHVTEEFVDAMEKISKLPKIKEAQAKMNGGLMKTFKADVVERQKETQEWIRRGGLEKCPTLVMWSFNDPSATMERCGIPCMDLIMSNVPESRMHIVNHAGHYCYREQPEEFEAVLSDFVRRYGS